MMSGYYPAGVTGNEYQIAGPQAEWTDYRTVFCGNEQCAQFNQEQDVELALEAYDWQEWGEWVCECGQENEYSGEIMLDEDDRIGEY